VSVSDDFDKNLELEIDSSAVKLNEAGKYPMHYRAVDASGNERVVTIYITVLDADEESVYSKADEILAKITNGEMSKYEKAKAIFNWISSHVNYTSTGEKQGVLQGARNAFVLRRGDCYTFYAAGEVLLTRAGIDNVGATRIENARNRHYWSLVNTGDGWYHFDTTPTRVKVDRFMFTEKQAQAYTRMLRAHYYDYDHEKYPEVVAE
jgi:hypothetical protein